MNSFIIPLSKWATSMGKGTGPLLKVCAEIISLNATGMNSEEIAAAAHTMTLFLCTVETYANVDATVWFINTYLLPAKQLLVTFIDALLEACMMFILSQFRERELKDLVITRIQEQRTVLTLRGFTRLQQHHFKVDAMFLSQLGKLIASDSLSRDPFRKLIDIGPIYDLLSQTQREYCMLMLSLRPEQTSRTIILLKGTFCMLPLSEHLQYIYILAQLEASIGIREIQRWCKINKVAHPGFSAHAHMWMSELNKLDPNIMKITLKMSEWVDSL